MMDYFIYGLIAGWVAYPFWQIIKAVFTNAWDSYQSQKEEK